MGVIEELKSKVNSIVLVLKKIDEGDLVFKPPYSFFVTMNDAKENLLTWNGKDKVPARKGWVTFEELNILVAEGYLRKTEKFFIAIEGKDWPEAVSPGRKTETRVSL